VEIGADAGHALLRRERLVPAAGRQLGVGRAPFRAVARILGAERANAARVRAYPLQTRRALLLAEGAITAGLAVGGGGIVMRPYIFQW
jgi:hypothetical protein